MSIPPLTFQWSVSGASKLIASKLRFGQDDTISFRLPDGTRAAILDDLSLLLRHLTHDRPEADSSTVMGLQISFKHGQTTAYRLHPNSWTIEFRYPADAPESTVMHLDDRGHFRSTPIIVPNKGLRPKGEPMDMRLAWQMARRFVETAWELYFQGHKNAITLLTMQPAHRHAIAQHSHLALDN